MPMKQAFKPSRILMLKSHSAGIGDVLRGSAAWRVLKNAYPEAELHLLLFSREPGYPSEELIRDHHLLNGFGVVDKRTNTWQEWRRFWADVERSIGQLRADLIIDFEPDGLRTSMVTTWYSWRWGARSVGISTVPGRNLFYNHASVHSKSMRNNARCRGRWNIRSAILWRSAPSVWSGKVARLKCRKPLPDMKRAVRYYGTMG